MGKIPPKPEPDTHSNGEGCTRPSCLQWSCLRGNTDREPLSSCN